MMIPEFICEITKLVPAVFVLFAKYCFKIATEKYLLMHLMGQRLN